METGDYIFDVPERERPDVIPERPLELAAWDRKNSLLCAEWAAFWERLGEHEQRQRAQHGDRYLGVRRSDAARAFRSRLLKTHGATEPSRVWCAFDDDRRQRLGREQRSVFK